MVVFADQSVGTRMKKAFFQLAAEKREKIVGACLAEFGAHDFERAALDRIVEAAGISKGGLYEYISSKEELYLFIVELSYGRLYEYLHLSLDHEGRVLPADLLQRFSLVSRTAIDFYIEHPEMIGIIARTSRIDDPALAEKARGIFDEHFSSIFDSAEEAGTRLPEGPARGAPEMDTREDEERLPPRDVVGNGHRYGGHPLQRGVGFHPGHPGKGHLFELRPRFYLDSSFFCASAD